MTIPNDLRAAVAAALLTTVAAGSLAAQTVSRTGGAGAPVLQLVTAPRAAALGGALAAADGAEGALVNPAAVAGVTRYGAHGSLQTLYDGSRAGSAALAYRFPLVAVGLTARYLDEGSIDEVVCDGCGGRGTATGKSLDAQETAIGAMAAVRLPLGFAVGAGVTSYASTVAADKGNAIAFSAGAHFAPLPFASLGASISNVGGDATVGGFAGKLPREIRVGAEVKPLYLLNSPVSATIAADVVNTDGGSTYVAGGLEVGATAPVSGVGVFGRVGMVSDHDVNFGSSGPRFGGGLRFRGVSVDYAYQSSDIFGGMHRVGLTVRR